MVEGLEKKAVPVEMVLSERVYTKQEARNAYEAVMVQLPQLILGNNPSLEDVRQNLNLLTYLDSYGIRLRWESDEPELLDSFGELHVQEMKQRGIGEAGNQNQPACAYDRGELAGGIWTVCVRKAAGAYEQEQTEAAFAEFLRERG